LDTLDELIDDWTSRVPARSALYCDQLVAAADVVPLLDGVVVVACVCVALDVLDDVDEDVVAAADELDFLELPPHPASSPTAATRATSTPRT
jgi:hypothetical protein